MDSSSSNSSGGTTQQQQLQKSMDSAIVTINEKGLIMSVDRKTCELFGYTIEELQSKKVNILIPSPYKEQHDTYLKNYFDTGVKKIIDKTRVVEGLHKDGSVFPITLSITEVFIWNKRMFIGSIEPVIDKRLILYTDVNGVMTYCNRAIDEMLGYTPSEIFGKNISTLMPAPHATSHQNYINKNYHGNGILKMLGRIRNLPIKHKSGVVFLVSILVTKISTDGIDMFKAIIQTPPQEAVFTVDNEGIIKSCNFNFTEPMFGYPQKELIGNTIGLLIPEMSKVIENQQQHTNQLVAAQSQQGSSSKIQSPSDYNPLDDREGIECWLGKIRKVNVYHKDGSNFPVNLEIIKLQPQHDGIESNFSIQIKRSIDPNHFNPNSNNNNNPNSNKKDKENKEKDKKRKLKRSLDDNDNSNNNNNIDNDKKVKKSKSSNQNSNNNQNNNLYINSSNSSVNSTSTSSSPPTLSPNTSYPHEMIGDYIIGKTLGRGNYGVVKLGTHIKSKLEIAIKIIYRDQMTDPEYQRCKREIEILKILNHPNINKLLNVLEKDDSMYIFMEYCTGGDLLGYINTGVSSLNINNNIIIQNQQLFKDHIKMGLPLSEEESRRIFTQISLGISHCHHLNIAHRDIKHKNILFDDKHNVKIIDFGLSNWSFQEKMSFCGTPVYAAPEMILGISYSGPEVDIWTLGIILFSLPTGYLPFPNVSDIINGKFTMPTYFSVELQDLIRQMLNVDREKRISMTNILQHPWIVDHNPYYQDIQQQLLQQQYQKQNISTAPNSNPSTITTPPTVSNQNQNQNQNQNFISLQNGYTYSIPTTNISNNNNNTFAYPGYPYMRYQPPLSPSSSPNNNINSIPSTSPSTITTPPITSNLNNIPLPMYTPNISLSPQSPIQVQHHHSFHLNSSGDAIHFNDNQQQQQQQHLSPTYNLAQYHPHSTLQIISENQQLQPPPPHIPTNLIHYQQQHISTSPQSPHILLNVNPNQIPNTSTFSMNPNQHMDSPYQQPSYYILTSSNENHQNNSNNNNE